jgi:hypothetical protein
MSRPRLPFPIERFHLSRWYHADTSLARYVLVVGLSTLVILAAGTLAAGPGHAQGQLQTPCYSPVTTNVQLTPTPQPPPSPTPGQAVPHLKLLPVVSGLLVVLVIGFVLLVLALFLILRAMRRRRRPAPIPTAAVPFLKSSDGHLYFRLDRLEGHGLIIGRGGRGVDLEIDESTPHADTVSERHAHIYYDPGCGHVIIEDLDSTNGIFINGRRAPRKNLLKDGWIVGLGKVTLTYRDGEADTGPLE